MSLFNYKQRNNIILVAIVILGCFLIWALQGLFSSILGAIVLYTIFRPFYLYLAKRARRRAHYPDIVYCYRDTVFITQYHDHR